MQTVTVDDLTLEQLWHLVRQGQMPEARYREIERERANPQPVPREPRR